MMRFTIGELARRGIPDERIRVSLERNMKCGVGWCGRCQLGPAFVCRNGPVFPYAEIERFFRVREA
jgi:NAD(P)H-flavin reductase